MPNYEILFRVFYLVHFFIQHLRCDNKYEFKNRNNQIEKSIKNFEKL